MRPMLGLAAVLIDVAVWPTLTSAQTQRVVGLIDAEVPALETIVVPTSVRVNVPFTATINTFGSPDCTAPDGVTLKLEPNRAEIIPYDRVPADSAARCSDEIGVHPHRVELRFTQVGGAVIEVDGEAVDPDTGRRTGSTKVRIISVGP